MGKNQPESYKRNPKDFVLWKPSSHKSCGWESPWGYGRPGWHIECTSMIKSIIGNEATLDIHGGGNDLIFPHHEMKLLKGHVALHQIIAIIGFIMGSYW